jgi:protein phosphatase
VFTEEFEPGDVYLLCSDGLTGMLSDPKILETIAATHDPAQATSKLIQLANDAGGLDNISAVLLRLELVDDVTAITQPPPAAPSATEAPAPPPPEPTPSEPTPSEPTPPAPTSSP